MFCLSGPKVFVIFFLFQVGRTEEITEEKFRTLLTELFNGGITRQKIVVLFVFCADVAVMSLKKEHPAVDVCVLCLKWAVQFMAENVCAWVQQHGGWVSSIYFSQRKKLSHCCVVDTPLPL